MVIQDRWRDDLDQFGKTTVWLDSRYAEVETPCWGIRPTRQCDCLIIIVMSWAVATGPQAVPNQHRMCDTACRLGPRRFTNVFDESKINRIRIFVMLWNEYDSFVRTKYPSDSRSTQRSNPVIYVKLCHRTIRLFFSIAFAVALTFIMLFIFNLVPRPSLFIRFSPALRYSAISERMQRINICDEF